MKVIEISRHGGPEVLVAAERAPPACGPGQVLIRVTAAGVNRPDVMQRMGLYPVPPGASDLPGLEVAGTIVDGDLGSSGFSFGDRVCALVPGGGYAEYCVAPANHCLPIPEGWSDAEAASLPEACFTVWSNVFDRARLAAGETLLIHGGSSGIGVVAIQMARALGHDVLVTAGSPEKCAACESLGARRAINYKTQDFAKEIKALTDGRGVDVILDMVGGSYLARNVASLADDGRLVVIALQGGAKAELPLAQLLVRRLSLTGSTLRPRSIAFKAAIAGALRDRVWPLIKAGRMRPVVDAVFPLEQAAEAHRRMEAGHHIGKIILAP